MGHDVIVDKYARLYEQPYQLAQLGNDVLGVCLSYRNCSIKDETHATEKGSLRWIGLSAGTYRLSILSHAVNLLKIAREFKPDIIVGISDCLHVILGQWIAQKINCIYAADLYDDYETFGLAKIPFVKTLYRRALSKAKVISCVSQPLSIYIKNNFAKNALVLALPSTINQSIFYPRNKNDMRADFNLPLNVPIIGTAGGLSKEKGIDTVYKAFTEIITQMPNAICVFAGPLDAKCLPPKHERIMYLGKLTHERVADFFCSLDVGIVYLKDTKYGQRSFPQKAYEMAACKIPVVAAGVGDVTEIFSDAYNELYIADNADSLTRVIFKQLESPHTPNVTIENWSDLAKKMLSAYTLAQKNAYHSEGNPI